MEGKNIKYYNLYILILKTLQYRPYLSAINILMYA